MRVKAQAEAERGGERRDERHENKRRLRGLVTGCIWVDSEADWSGDDVDQQDMCWDVITGARSCMIYESSQRGGFASKRFV